MNKNFDILKVGQTYINNSDELVVVVKELEGPSAYAFQVKRLEFKCPSPMDMYNVTVDGTTWFDGRSSELDIKLSPQVIRSVVPTEDIEVLSLTIGCDPELILLHQIGCVSANIFAHTKNKGNYSFGSYGVDTSNFIMELRPKESENPFKVVENLQSCILQACKNNNSLYKLHWLAGAAKEDNPIGGHIHFGVKRSPFMVPMLDKYLAAFYMLFEDKQEAIHRKSGRGYGRLGDARFQTWGFEYRTLSSWIYSPMLSLAVLSLAKHIINQFFYKDSGVFEDKSLQNYLSEDWSASYIAHDKEVFRELFEDHWPTVKSWPTEQNLKQGLEIFESLVVCGYSVDEKDIKRNWGITENA